MNQKIAGFPCFRMAEGGSLFLYVIYRKNYIPQEARTVYFIIAFLQTVLL